MRYETADLVVVGGGIMGACVAWQAARRKLSVILVEQFRPGHRQGSSHGESRIIRYAYPEQDYVSLMRDAYRAWAELSDESQDSGLYVRSGGLDLGARDDAYLAACRAAMDEQSVPYEVLDAAGVRSRFPQFTPGREVLGVFQPDAGLIAADRALAAAWRVSERRGVRAFVDRKVDYLDLEYDRPTAVTPDIAFRGRAMVVSAGPWLGKLMPELAPALKVTRQQYGLFRPTEPALFEPGRFPVYIVQDEEGMFYGLPPLGREGVKVAEHGGGPVVDPDAKRPARPDPKEMRRLQDFLRRWIPDAAGEFLHGEICHYTNTPDTDFLLAPSGLRSDVVVAGGFSGHGFKFAPLVGRLAVGLASGEGGPAELARFRLDRPAMQDAV